LWDMMLCLSQWLSGSQYFASTMIISNNGNHSSGNTALYIRKLKLSRTPHEKLKSGNSMGDSEKTFSCQQIGISKNVTPSDKMPRDESCCDTMCYKPSYHTCFQLIIIFRTVAAKTLFQHWKRKNFPHIITINITLVTQLYAMHFF